MKRTFARVFLAIGLLLASAAPAQALVKLGSDFFFTGLYTNTNELGLRSHNYLFLEIGPVAFGPYFNYEPLHSYVTDISYGAGLRIGEKWYFEIDGGPFQRNYAGTTATGFAGSLILGYHFSRWLSLSIPLIVKRIQTGLESRFIVDTVPYFGLRLEL